MKGLLKILGFVIFLVTFIGTAQVDTISIENVNVIPMDTDTILKNQRVSIAGKKIISIESANRKPTASAQLKIDGTGNTLSQDYQRCIITGEIRKGE